MAEGPGWPGQLGPQGATAKKKKKGHRGEGNRQTVGGGIDGQMGVANSWGGSEVGKDMGYRYGAKSMWIWT